MTERTRLNNRRQGYTDTVEVDGIKAECTVNFYGDAAAAEVFISSPKPGSSMSMVLNDAAVIISIALQYGIPAQALAKSIARIEGGDEPASVIGAALDTVIGHAQARAELRQAVKEIGIKYEAVDSLIRDKRLPVDFKVTETVGVMLKDPPTLVHSTEGTADPYPERKVPRWPDAKTDPAQAD